MKFMKDQNGYALLVVLLMVVLFLGISATFMAGSLSNAKQEKTVDTSNQAVASAEMGVRYFSTDFQRDLGMITKEVTGKTRDKLLELRNCFQSKTDTTCDEQLEITNKEKEIDNEMLNLYVTLILSKVDELVDMQGDEFLPFSADQIKYSIKSATATKLNQLGEDITAAGVTDTKIREINVLLEMEGSSDGVKKTLDATFSIEVPDTFLNPSDPLTIHTETVIQDGVTYSDIFSSEMPAKTCAQLLAEVKAGTSTGIIECSLGEGENLADFIDDILAEGMDPADFRVHTDNFLENVCPDIQGNSCNGFDFHGISVVIAEGDIMATNNMNNLEGVNFIINGMWSVDNNIQNLGDMNGDKQTIVLKELEVRINFKGMVNTNLIVLGGAEVDGVMPQSTLDFGNKNQNFNVGEAARFCIDIDKIDTTDLADVKNRTTFSDGGLLIYFSRDADAEFVLTGDNAVERNKSVVKELDYTTFLSACGLTLKYTISNLTDVSVVDNLDPGFDLDVEY